MRALRDLNASEKRMTNAADRLNTFVQDCIDEHCSKHEPRSHSKAETEGEQVKDFVNMLLEGENDFGDKNRKVLMKVAFIAGTKAAASGMTWTLPGLIRHPELMERAQDELDFVVERDCFKKKTSLDQLELLGAIVTDLVFVCINHHSQFLAN